MHDGHQDRQDAVDDVDWRDRHALAEPMRGQGSGPRRQPSTDDKRIRRRMRRGGAVAQEENAMPQTREELLKAISAAPTLHEQARLIGHLDTLDQGERRQAALDAEVDLSRARIAEAMTPVASRTSRATTASDWIVDLPEAEPIDHNGLVAQAALWFGSVHPMVLADAGEFEEQVRGAARQATSSADGVAVFTNYAHFLRERTAASGLDQIQQTTAPDGVTQRPTPLDPTVFDNFAPPVADINTGVVGTETSDRAPAIQQAVNGGGNSTPEVPGGHQESGQMTGPGPEPSLGGGGSSAPEEPGGHQDAGAEPAQGDPTRRQAASGLPMIQQTTDPHDAPAATLLPTDVAYPWTMGGSEDGIGGEAHYDTGGEVPSQHQSTVAHRRTADQWTQPSPVIHPQIANSPATTPPRTPADAGSGAADARDPQAAPSFGDAHAAGGYTDSYTGAAPAAHAQDVPVSIGGDNGQSQQHPAYASRKIATRDEMRHPDFQRGYKYAAKWRPGVPLVRTGTPELEAGIYAGFTDRSGHRADWLSAHASLAQGAPELGHRILAHRQLTHQVAAAQGLPTDGTYLQAEAATGVDLDAVAPGTSPSPNGDTPINGPGRPGPLAGGMDASAPGGPSPYNGAEPVGSPVVPQTPTAPSGTPQTVPDSGMTAAIPGSINSATAAFRRRVQAGLLNDKKG
ncbi:hypothetical protein ACFZAM_32085 [Streptomyces sp. NPDC008079]|uniref:hypothetical protein n=1 Tax=Streptomyces sp. NPDC008079 TaxID=3364806 RepID=UPI0036EF1958